jgi:hypothetical protein
MALEPGGRKGRRYIHEMNTIGKVLLLFNHILK